MEEDLGRTSPSMKEGSIVDSVSMGRDGEDAWRVLVGDESGVFNSKSLIGTASLLPFVAGSMFSVSPMKTPYTSSSAFVKNTEGEGSRKMYVPPRDFFGLFAFGSW